MNWLNLPVSTARHPAFIGCEPVARATWLSVLLYCVEQENGGVLKGARAWKDRQWQQTCGVTLAEVDGCGMLLEWKGENLIVALFPKEKQAEVRRLRAQSKEAANRRWGSNARPMPSGMPRGMGLAMPEGNAEGERKEKEKEEEREREENVPATAGAAPPPAAPKRAPADTDEPWIASVETMDCYRAVPVRIELGKAQAWCGQNHRQCTRKFFINWLNRALDNHRAIAGGNGPGGVGHTSGLGRMGGSAALHKTPSRFGF